MKNVLFVVLCLLALHPGVAQDRNDETIQITWIDAPEQVNESYVTLKWGIKAKSQITDVCIKFNGMFAKGINAVANDGFDMKKSQVIKLEEGENLIEILVYTKSGNAKSERKILLIPNDDNNYHDDFGDYENVDSMLHAAYSGEGEAQYLLAKSYLKGTNGLGKDLFESSLWFKKSAEHNYAPAQYEYAIALMEGRGIIRSLVLAIYWLEQAVQQECADALLKLGVCYETGEGVKRDIEKAKELYRKCPLAEAKQRLNALEK